MRATVCMSLSVVFTALVAIVLLLHSTTKRKLRALLPYYRTSLQCTRYLASRKMLKSVPPVPQEIPVWMFWDGPTRPTLVELCLGNWKYWCRQSEYNFVPILVTGEDLHEFVDADAHDCLKDTDRRALKSDFIRLMLLHKYGGLYMDATVIVTSPLDWLIGRNEEGHMIFQAMYNASNMSRSCHKPVVETSMLFAPPRHGIITAWLDGLMQLSHCDGGAIRRSVDKLPLEKNLFYEYHFAYHVMAGIQNKVDLSTLGAFHLYDCRREKYLSFQHNEVNSLCTARGEVAHGRILKLISQEHKDIEDRIQRGLIEKGSFVHQHLMSVHRDTQLAPLHIPCRRPFAS